MTIQDQLSLLLQLSASLQRAHTKFRDSGREDIAQQIRNAQWDVDAAFAMAQHRAEVTS